MFSKFVVPVAKYAIALIEEGKRQAREKALRTMLQKDKSPWTIVTVLKNSADFPHLRKEVLHCIEEGNYSAELFFMIGSKCPNLQDYALIKLLDCNVPPYQMYQYCISFPNHRNEVLRRFAALSYKDKRTALDYIPSDFSDSRSVVSELNQYFGECHSNKIPYTPRKIDIN